MCSIELESRAYVNISKQLFRRNTEKAKIGLGFVTLCVSNVVSELYPLQCASGTGIVTSLDA
jgi:hypothetical protein